MIKKIIEFYQNIIHKNKIVLTNWTSAPKNESAITHGILEYHLSFKTHIFLIVFAWVTLALYTLASTLKSNDLGNFILVSNSKLLKLFYFIIIGNLF